MNKMSCFVQTCDQTITGMKNILDSFKDFFFLTRGLDFERVQSKPFFSKIHAVQLTLMIVTGRQFSYDRALQIMQDEAYLDNLDFDEIKKIGRFDPNMNIPQIRQRWISKASEYKHWEGKTHNTHAKSGHSHRVKR